MMHITRVNSEDIAFVIACLLSDAISAEEVTKWAEHVISSEDEYPDYVLDLLDYDGNPPSILKILGFTPVWNSTQIEQMAVVGIVYVRGFEPYEKDVPRADAISALRSSENVKGLFAKNFPFIDVPFT